MAEKALVAPLLVWKLSLQCQLRICAFCLVGNLVQTKCFLMGWVHVESLSISWEYLHIIGCLSELAHLPNQCYLFHDICQQDINRENITSLQRSQELIPSVVLYGLWI